MYLVILDMLNTFLNFILQENEAGAVILPLVFNEAIFLLIGRYKHMVGRNPQLDTNFI